MNTKEYLKNLTTAEKKEIKKSIKKIEEQRLQDGTAGIELIFLFDMWHKLFPKVRQNTKCGSCRRAVIKFFTLLSKDIKTKKVKVG